MIPSNNMKKYTDETAEVYTKLGKTYLSLVAHATPEEIHIFCEKMPKRARILDLGCAGGRDSKIFADRGFDVVGIDLCDPFLEEAKKNVPSGTFLKKDFLDLDLPTTSFDGIWACASLLHLKKTDVGKTMESLYHLLKQGGHIFVGVKQGKGEDRIIDTLSNGHHRFFSFYEKEEIETMITNAGFNVLYTKIQPDRTGRAEVKWIMLIAQKSARSQNASR